LTFEIRAFIIFNVTRWQAEGLPETCGKAAVLTDIIIKILEGIIREGL
jgi:hypothetical protein